MLENKRDRTEPEVIPVNGIGSATPTPESTVAVQPISVFEEPNYEPVRILLSRLLCCETGACQVTFELLTVSQLIASASAD